MEQAEARCKAKAAVLVKQFKEQFRDIVVTVHPSGIPGEAQGKSSNLCWAAGYLKGKYELEKPRRSVVVTVIDGKNLIRNSLGTAENCSTLQNLELEVDFYQRLRSFSGSFISMFGARWDMKIEGYKETCSKTNTFV